MNKLFLMILLFFGMPANGNTQNTTTTNPAFDAELNRLLSFTVPLISVDELKARLHEVQIFDAREWDEYTVSHLPGAVYIGYKNFNKNIFEKMKKDQPIVLYCSVGYRSEKIGEKLQKMGFTNVHNLYGSIFEWVNKGYPIENFSEKNAKKIHTYNKKWSRWVTNPKVEKVW